jgi:hypothetical protein
MSSLPCVFYLPELSRSMGKVDGPTVNCMAYSKHQIHVVSVQLHVLNHAILMQVLIRILYTKLDKMGIFFFLRKRWGWLGIDLKA